MKFVIIEKTTFKTLHLQLNKTILNKSFNTNLINFISNNQNNMYDKNQTFIHSAIIQKTYLIIELSMSLYSISL